MTSHGTSRSRNTGGDESACSPTGGSLNCCCEAMVAQCCRMVDCSATAVVGMRADRGAALPSFSMTAAAAGASGLTPEQISAIDAAHLWHPYSTIGGSDAGAAPPNVVAVGARGARLTLIHNGAHVEVLDAMSSWWTAIHGHGHPVLDAALTAQLATMSHVMFGGL